MAQRHPWRPAADVIERLVCDELGITRDRRRSRNEQEARRAFACLARELGGLRLREIAARLGLSEAQASRLARDGARSWRGSWGGSPLDRIERRIAELEQRAASRADN